VVILCAFSGGRTEIAVGGARWIRGAGGVEGDERVGAAGAGEILLGGEHEVDRVGLVAGWAVELATGVVVGLASGDGIGRASGVVAARGVGTGRRAAGSGGLGGAGGLGGGLGLDGR
jgi:hypothetical protein